MADLRIIEVHAFSKRLKVLVSGAPAVSNATSSMIFKTLSKDLAMSDDTIVTNIFPILEFR